MKHLLGGRNKMVRVAIFPQPFDAAALDGDTVSLVYPDDGLVVDAVIAATTARTTGSFMSSASRPVSTGRMWSMINWIAGATPTDPLGCGPTLSTCPLLPRAGQPDRGHGDDRYLLVAKPTLV